MVTVKFKKEERKLIVYLEGKFDTYVSVKDYKYLLNDEFHAIDELVLDFTSISSISSAALRTLVDLKKFFNNKKISIINENKTVYNLLLSSGLTDILNVSNIGTHEYKEKVFDIGEYEKTERSAILRCALCYNPHCSDSCIGKINPGRILRAVWFDNDRYISFNLPKDNPCLSCAAPCETACIRSGEVRIKELISMLYKKVKPYVEDDMRLEEQKKESFEKPEVIEENSCVKKQSGSNGTESNCRIVEKAISKQSLQIEESQNLSYDVLFEKKYSRLKTDFCGVPLENPFLLSSSVVSSNFDMCDRAFSAGWAGAAFKTICNFEIHETSPRFSAITSPDGSMIGFKNIEQLSDHSLKENMETFRKLKEKHPTKFILASVMGQNEDEWGELSALCQENGADAIELNFSCPNMAEEGLGSDIGQVPALVERFTKAAKSKCTIPVIAKLTPNVAFMSPAAEAAMNGGADGIAAINTIKSITGVNIHTYVAEPAVKGRSALGGYSGAAVKPIALRFISELGLNSKLKGLHISGMGGIETYKDALEFLLMGSSSLQITTAVMQYGYRIIDDLLAGLDFYLQEKGFSSVKDIVGLGLSTVSETTDFLERDSIVFPNFNRKKCIGCGRCYVSCLDGGHQAISFREDRPVLLSSLCVGCHLCVLVCPEKAISPGRIRIFRSK